MDSLPPLDLYVTGHCKICLRAERALRACDVLEGIVKLVVHRLDEPGTLAPPSVVGGPTLVFRGRVVGLGTPDCSELAARITKTLANQTQ